MKRIAIILACGLSLLLQTSTALTRNETAAAVHAFPATASLMPRPLDHGGKIEMKYDGFNHETIVTLKRMLITCGGAKGLQSTMNETCISFVASLHCPGVQLDYVRYAKLQLIFESKDWDRRHPLDERDLAVVVDGEQFKLGTMTLATQGLDTTHQLIDVMREVLDVSVPYKTFNKIARAQTVEMKVGKTMFELQEKNVDALRDLNNRVKVR
jgi:hypothetical protein